MPVPFNVRKWGDHVLTYFVEGCVMLGTIAVYKLAAMKFGDEGFNIYAVVRRTSSFIVPFAMMGLSVAVVRYVAMCNTEEERWTLVRGAGLFLLLLGIVIALLFAFMPGPLAFMIFGDREQAHFALPIGGMVAGQMMHALMYSYWRGALRMKLANGLQFISLALIPVLAFFVGRSLEQVLQITAIAWLFVSVVPFLLLLIGGRTERSEKSRSLKQLLRYGLPRVPGDLALAALLTLPVYLVNHVEGVESGGQVAFGLTLLNIVGALFAPVSLLMLPSVARALARDDHGAVVREVQRTRNLTVVIVLAIVAIFQLLAAPLLEWYVGGAPEGLIPAARILFSGALFFALFISLRSMLDAYFEKARNSLNLLIALACLAIGGLIYLFLWPQREFLLWMVPASFLVLAVLTWRDVHGVVAGLKKTIGPDRSQDVQSVDRP